MWSKQKLFSVYSLTKFWTKQSAISFAFEIYFFLFLLRINTPYPSYSILSDPVKMEYGLNALLKVSFAISN